MNARDLPPVSSASAAADFASLVRLAGGSGLEAHFQPIASLREGTLFGYEGLIRGPEGSRYRCPLALFEGARAAGLGLALETACARVVVRAFVERGLPGRLAVNFSAPAIERLAQRPRRALDFLMEEGVAPHRLVVELTEHERVADFGALERSVAGLRAMGVAFALDDFGDGHSSLRLWAELAPELVKIDKYFIRGLHADRARLHCVKALVQLGEVFGTRLVAEGIEADAELRVLRELGIELGQGYLLGRPEPDPARRGP